LVVGIETDLAYTDLNRTTTLPLPPGVPLQALYNSKLKELGTVRGRLGYAIGPVLIYGTGGFAYGEALRTVSVTAGGTTLARMTVDDFETGYAVGGGLEYALPTGTLMTTLPGAVTLRAEYLHYNLGQRATPLSLLGQNTVTRMRTDGDLGRVGLNYKF
ncbi:outer membrane beta-barrel protein, partial [Lichenihabitans sp. Uapishka_5]|uniref:outer membrane protein n=1 Tax=Lichenihabitans sp. Uapishka_5 TaxID=3037302 RepID=UPI0029E80E32